MAPSCTAAGTGALNRGGWNTVRDRVSVTGIAAKELEGRRRVVLLPGRPLGTIQGGKIGAQHVLQRLKARRSSRAATGGSAVGRPRQLPTIRQQHACPPASHTAPHSTGRSAQHPPDSGSLSSPIMPSNVSQRVALDTTVLPLQAGQRQGGCRSTSVLSVAGGCAALCSHELFCTPQTVCRAAAAHGWQRAAGRTCTPGHLPAARPLLVPRLRCPPQGSPAARVNVVGNLQPASQPAAHASPQLVVCAG